MRHFYGLFLLCMVANTNSETGSNEFGKSNNEITSLQSRSSYSASERLDSQISYLINKLPGLISSAKNTINDDGSSKELRFQIYGASIIVAAVKEITSDWIINERTILNFGGSSTLYSYGFLLFYGFGFGLGATWSIPPFSEVTCGPYEWKRVIYDYGFQDGVAPYLHGYQESLGLSSKLCEFEAVLKMKLNCILSQEDSYIEAAEVAYAVDELIQAMKIRLDWEMKY